MRSERMMISGLEVVEHSFEVPLDHAHEEGERITVFARELGDPDAGELPFLVYFQGGPGFEAPRPTRNPTSPGWLERALKEYRVLMLDQRGTGRSTPVGSLADRTPPEQADYLAHFRADSIVRDAEWIRRELEVEAWSVLGQSFGGFCVTTYLSFAPEGLNEAFITGGLPPLGRHVDEVYAHTYARVRTRNSRYFERYPGDRERMKRLREELEAEDLRLPGGDRLTWRRVRQLGFLLGVSDGAERLHYILELPPRSRGFQHDAADTEGFARNPLYAVLHEACYADGGATRWSAERVLPPDFDADGLLTGEHIYPWMFEEYGELTPLADAAHLLAERQWPRLYDPEALKVNRVPAAAAIYAEDMYVEREFSEDTARNVRGLRTWLTSEYDHNGLRVDGERILGRLIDLAHDRV